LAITPVADAPRLSALPMTGLVEEDSDPAGDDVSSVAR
jgi:hypothetical protein